MDIIGAVAIAVLLWVGRNQVNRHMMTQGAFITFIIAVFRLYDPVRKFALFHNNFQQALGASQEIFRFMDEQDEIKDNPDAQVLPPFRKSVRFEDVCFSYREAENDGL